MSTTRNLTTVTLARSDEPLTVIAETTTNPHLAIAPGINSHTDGGLSLADAFMVVHAPTGRTIPTGFTCDLHSVRRFVDEIARHDWSFTDPHHLANTDEGKALRQAVVEAQRGAGEVKPDEEEEQSSVDLPKTAAGAVPDAVRAAQKAWTRWFNGDDQVPKQDLGTKEQPNHAYMALLLCALYAFDRAYLLGALHRIDPRAADSAVCWLAEQHEQGDSVGEFLWEWNEQVERGEMPRLPGALPAVADPTTVELGTAP